MADKFTHMSGYAVKLDEIGMVSTETVYALAVSLADSTIGVLQTVNTVSEIVNVSSLDTVDKILSVNTITEITNISNLDSVNTITKILSINTVSLLSNVLSVDTVDSITNIQTLQAGTVTVLQSTHDNLNCNANIQVGNTDVSATNLVPVKSNNSQVSATQTRPDNATPYSIGDVVGTDVATNMTFANVCSVNGAGFIITGCSLEIDVNAVPSGMTSFRLHLFNAAPTAITDNLAFNLIAADRAKYLGYIDLTAPVDLGDTLWSQNDNLNFKSKLAAAATSLYGVLETRTAYTPSASTVKKVELKVVEV